MEGRVGLGGLSTGGRWARPNFISYFSCSSAEIGLGQVARLGWVTDHLLCEAERKKERKMIEATYPDRLLL